MSIWIETMSAPEEVTRGRPGGHRGRDCPYVATCSFDTAGRTMMGMMPGAFPDVFADLAASPLAIGANCGVGASDILVSVLEMAERAGHHIVSKGNCGVPQFQGTEIVYSGTPELMGRYAGLAADAGARIVGGCCGTSPEHLAAMRAALDQRVAGPQPTLDHIVEHIGPLANSVPTAGDAPGADAAAAAETSGRGSAAPGRPRQRLEQLPLGAGLGPGHRPVTRHDRRGVGHRGAEPHQQGGGRRAGAPDPGATVHDHPVTAPQAPLDGVEEALHRLERWGMEVGNREPHRPVGGRGRFLGAEPGDVLGVAGLELVGFVQADDGGGIDPGQRPFGVRAHEVLAAQPQPSGHPRDRDLVDAAVERAVARPPSGHREFSEGRRVTGATVDAGRPGPGITRARRQAPGANASSAFQSSTPGPSTESGWMQTWSAPAS